MSLCFRSFNYPSSINCCLNKHATSQGKRSPALVNFPQAEACESSVFVNKSSEDRRIRTPRDNSIGIIGGVSIDSCLDFTKKLVNCKGEDGQESSPPFILCSDPTLNKKLLFLERSQPSKDEGLLVNDDDKSRIVTNLRCKRAFLEKSGVCCIAMPCHLLHHWHDEIREGCSVPFLHVGECVAHELKEAKMRPLEAGSPLRVGVLATNEVLVGSFYQDKLENEGFEVVLPDKATMEHTVIPAVEALSRKDLEGAQNLFRIALQVLLVRAVNRVVLASDEFRELLPPGDPLWSKCVDPMEALARSAVEYARSVW
ncbi:uncharacterized protein LOC127254945 [Andrographis paniculata]|uniref:uncharacterized protein LOC127254945 n=1 Tax=Andrographis paniculata TaxID=175694 RepID=UPI0021E764A7|nr:uncharacterized protein LOC127254945 [Andrographis paniculata]XP_051136266.1 uncharacterized protein LOC127254945 [Andrographis paniculata]XP_051136267.1 uncharacterized protein LOC127254945 [Andrographis paniculata]